MSPLKPLGRNEDSFEGITALESRAHHLDEHNFKQIALTTNQFHVMGRRFPSKKKFIFVTFPNILEIGSEEIYALNRSTNYSITGRSG